jgi:hypothetical protein
LVDIGFDERWGWGGEERFRGCFCGRTEDVQAVKESGKFGGANGVGVECFCIRTKKLGRCSFLASGLVVGGLFWSCGLLPGV